MVVERARAEDAGFPFVGGFGRITFQVHSCLKEAGRCGGGREARRARDQRNVVAG